MGVLRRLHHLTTRFFDVLGAGGLSPREQTEVSALLRQDERAVFWDQLPADQRHGLDCARWVLQARPGRLSLARAALLHDIGKRHARLGVVGRSVASGLDLLRVPLGGRFRCYLRHGELGAADLEAAGAEALVVDYARHHHSGRPASIPVEEWALLDAADHDAKPPARGAREYT